MASPPIGPAAVTSADGAPPGLEDLGAAALAPLVTPPAVEDLASLDVVATPRPPDLESLDDHRALA